MLQLWSPMANITTEEFRKASETLPMPTGYTEITDEQLQKLINTGKLKPGEEPEKHSIYIEETDDINKALELFSKYGDLFRISHSRIRNRQLEKQKRESQLSKILEAKAEIKKLKQDRVDTTEAQVRLDLLNEEYKTIKNTEEWEFDYNHINIEWDLSTPDKLIKFGQMLKEIKTIFKPSESYIKLFNTKFIQLTGFVQKTDSQFNEIFTQIQETIDSHNLYFTRVNDKILSNISNNYTMNQMYNTIADPVNLIEAHTSVDGTTGPLKKIAEEKSIESKEAKQRTPGNTINKYESIIENQVGKECIGICATGLKAFFGLTQYNNYILNYGTSEQQKRLLIGPNGKGHKIGGKLYKTLANIRSNNPNTIINEEVLEALANVTNDTDAALILSALLSLSTDNAKELTLSKLNATTKTIGMYIYGIAIGMEFKDVANIIMSDTGRILSSLLSDNVFSGRSGYFKALDAFDYFERCPYRELQKYNVSYDLDGNSIGKSPLKFFQEQFLKQNPKFKADKKFNLYEAITTYAKSDIPLSDKLNQIDAMRGLYNSASTYRTELYNKLIDYIEEYINNISKTDENAVKDLYILAGGAQELRTMGSIFSLNQGIKTSMDEVLRQINLIERCIYEKTGNERDIINLSYFVFNEEYRNECILKYEAVKHSFNILDAVATTPHFMGYVEMLAIAQEENMQSFKFRSTKNILLRASNDLGYTDESKLAKGIQDYVGDYLRKQWMLDNEITIIIPAGNKFFQKDGTEITLSQDTPVRLGTDWGDATFRAFMETQIIPDLKIGKLSGSKGFSGTVNNTFIRDLGNDLFTHTVSRNPTIVQSLSINMLPRTDAERSILNQYISDFNNLAQWKYSYNTTIYDSGGNTHNIPQEYSIIDLFTYYAMIANQWKLGENSLVPILADFQNIGIIRSFHDFVAAYDRSQKTLQYTVEVQSELLPYIAPSDSPYTAKTSYIWYRNPETKKMQLMKKQNKEDSLDFNDFDGEPHKDPNVIKKYRFVESNLDTNYFTTSRINSTVRSDEFSYNDNGNNVPVVVKWDQELGRLISIQSGSTQIDISGINNPFIKINGIREINKDLVEGEVRKQLNCK